MHVYVAEIAHVVEHRVVMDFGISVFIGGGELGESRLWRMRGVA